MLPPIFWYILVFFFGLAIGSFLNVLIFRLPEEEEVVHTHSHCRSCGKTLEWFELVPLFSYIFLRGRCRSCPAPISIQYPLVELATGLLFVCVVWVLNKPLLHAISYKLVAIGYVFFVISCLMVIFVTDLRHFIIPDSIVFPAIAVSLATSLVNRFVFSCQLSIVNCQWLPILWSLAGALFFLGLVVVSRGTWMGLGDVKLAVLMGLFLGLAKLIVALLMAFFAGSLVGALLIAARKKTLKSEIPFGTFLAPATLVAFFFGDTILQKFHLLPFRW